jgi:hypothetical protein
MLRPPRDVIVDFTSVAPVLLVEDVAATAGWYEARLHFKCDAFPAAPPFTHAILWRDDVRILLRARTNGAPSPGGLGALLEVKGIVAFYEAIQSRVEVTSRLERHADGTWQFEIRDPDGYTLVFTEEPEVA